MKKIELATSSSPNFIGCWNIENPKLCEDLIAYFDTNAHLQRPGEAGGGRNTDIKRSTDIVFQPKFLTTPGAEVIQDYLKNLSACFEAYKEEWPFVQSIFNTMHVGSFNLQKYDAGGHFGREHCERTSLATSHRVLAWMTYLNDVEDGGSTCFSYYGLKVKPEAGKTLIWPAEWTHLHCGEVVNSGSKYIMTGWFHFPYGEESDFS